MACEFEHVLRHAESRERRYAQVHMGPDQLLRWLASAGRERPVVVGLPEDAGLVNVAYDFLTGTIALTVEHESFPPVPPGTTIPRLPLEVRLVPADAAGDDD